MGSYYFISFVGALQGVLLSLVFFVRKGYHPAARMLGWYVFIFSLGLLEKFANTNLSGVTKDVVGGFLGFSNFLYGPLLYLFVEMLTDKEPGFRRKHLYHMLPFFVGYGLLLAGVFFGNFGNERVDGTTEFVLFELLVVQLLAYNVLAIRKLARHREKMLQTYSTLDAKDLNWLRFYLIFITGIYVLSIGITHLVVLGIKAQPLYVAVQLAITMLIYLMSYRIVFQPGMFSLVVATEPEEVKEDVGPATEKYQRSGLKTEQAAGYLAKLLDHMELTRPYLDQELAIYTLAEQLGITRNHLTQIINEELGKNFYEFVNAYRVEAAKQMMGDKNYDHLTLSAIGLEAGFKSKTAFNTNFKKLAGVTPTEWKKTQQLPGESIPREVPA